MKKHLLLALLWATGSNLFADHVWPNRHIGRAYQTEDNRYLIEIKDEGEAPYWIWCSRGKYAHSSLEEYANDMDCDTQYTVGGLPNEFKFLDAGMPPTQNEGQHPPYAPFGKRDLNASFKIAGNGIEVACGAGQSVSLKPVPGQKRSELGAAHADGSLHHFTLPGHPNSSFDPGLQIEGIYDLDDGRVLVLEGSRYFGGPGTKRLRMGVPPNLKTVEVKFDSMAHPQKTVVTQGGTFIDFTSQTVVDNGVTYADEEGGYSILKSAPHHSMKIRQNISKGGLEELGLRSWIYSVGNMSTPCDEFESQGEAVAHAGSQTPAPADNHR